jgi:hypothetical protein
MAQAVHSIPATRLVLNLRERSHTRGPQDGQRPDEITMDHMSDMNFAPRISWDQNTLPFAVGSAHVGDVDSTAGGRHPNQRQAGSNRSWNDYTDESWSSKTTNRDDGWLNGHLGMPSLSTNYLI